MNSSTLVVNCCSIFAAILCAVLWVSAVSSYFWLIGVDLQDLGGGLGGGERVLQSDVGGSLEFSLLLP